MSQANVETYKRGVGAFNRRDIEGLLEELDPGIEMQLALPAMFGGEATAFRGHDGCRNLVRDLDEAFAELQIEISEIRDLGSDS